MTGLPNSVLDWSRTLAGGGQPSELMAQLDRRIDVVDRHVLAITQRFDTREAFCLADQRRAGQRPLSTIDGIPFLVKDIVSVAGGVTTGGSAALRNFDSVDAQIVAALRVLGAIPIGKVTMSEFATGAVGGLPALPARNPWNLALSPGISSSGSAAAVAAGLAPFSLATDTAGSTRGPAALCGIVGFKPSSGSYRIDGVFPLAWSFDTVGLMARTVADCALLHHLVIKAAPLPPRSIAGLRMGRVVDWGLPLRPEVRDALARFDRVLLDAGATLVDVELPKLDDWETCARVIIRAEAYALHATRLRDQPEKLAPLTRMRLMSGAGLLADDYLTAQRMRTALQRTYANAFEQIDLLVAPVNTAETPTLAQVDQMRAIPSSSVLVTPFNVAGAPSIALPAGNDRSGMPIGIQIASRVGADSELLAISSALEILLGEPCFPPEANLTPVI